MKNKSDVSTWIIARALVAASVVMLGACAGRNNMDDSAMMVATPTVDYVESLDVYSAPHQDSFLNQLAMNYRSYAIYNARTSGYPEMGELFASKAVAAFSGELPFPESLENWPVDGDQQAFELYTAYNELMEQLQNDASSINPELAAEAQAKYDCWLSAAASGQTGTARECRDRYFKTMTALRDCKGGKIVSNTASGRVSGVQKSAQSAMQTSGTSQQETLMVAVTQNEVVTNASNTPTDYYPDTRNMNAMNGAGRAREGVIIVNNVNVPEHLINPVPVQPMVFNQNIYGGDKTVNSGNTDNSVCERYDAKGECTKFITVPFVVESQPEPVPCPSCPDCPSCEACPDCPDCIVVPPVNEDLVTREEFINMMMAMRNELAAINARLDGLQAQANSNAATLKAVAEEKTIIKVQQIPLEPKQHVMEEVLEIRFDFNKAQIKPEYQDLIRKLATATQENKNIKVSVVGHTDTMGTKNYNYSLGGRRAEAVQKMLIEYGIPAAQIVAVSAGEEDLAVPTADGVANAENRRVKVVKEIHYTEDEPESVTMIEQYPSSSDCGGHGCNE